MVLVWVEAVGPTVEGAEGVTELKSTDWIKGDRCWRCSSCAGTRHWFRHWTLLQATDMLELCCFTLQLYVSIFVPMLWLGSEKKIMFWLETPPFTTTDMAGIHPNEQKTNPEKVSRGILLFSETKSIMEVEFQVERLFCTDSCGKKERFFSEMSMSHRKQYFSFICTLKVWKVNLIIWWNKAYHWSLVADWCNPLRSPWWCWSGLKLLVQL